MILLFLKCTLILLTAALGCLVLRKQPAAARRVVWLAGLSATLLLPLGWWLPKTYVALPLIVASGGPCWSQSRGTGSVDPLDQPDLGSWREYMLCAAPDRPL